MIYHYYKYFNYRGLKKNYKNKTEKRIWLYSLSQLAKADFA